MMQKIRLDLSPTLCAQIRPILLHHRSSLHSTVRTAATTTMTTHPYSPRQMEDVEPVPSLHRCWANPPMHLLVPMKTCVRASSVTDYSQYWGSATYFLGWRLYFVQHPVRIC